MGIVTRESILTVETDPRICCYCPRVMSAGIGTRRHATTNVLEAGSGGCGWGDLAVCGECGCAEALQLRCRAADGQHQRLYPLDAGQSRRGSQISARALRAFSEHGR